MIIKKVCAWCGRYIGYLKCKNHYSSSSHISHGICEDCLEVVMAELEEAVNHYIQKNGEIIPGKEDKDE
jgi:hypothetical protein